MTSKTMLLLTLVYATLATQHAHSENTRYLMHKDKAPHTFTEDKQAKKPNFTFAPSLLDGLTYWIATCSECKTLCIGGTCGYELVDQDPSLPARRR